MKKGIMKNGLAAGVVALGFVAFSTPVSAVPSLQLDVTGGVYDLATETSVSTTAAFELNAYLLPDDKATTGDTYYLSIAIVPKYGSEPGDLGSFVFNGITYDVTDDMVYGNPPVELGLSHDGGDLGPHDIYDTYFVELAFKFDECPQDGGMCTESFSVDASGLDDGYALHFDLYNEKVKRGDTDIRSFAPFSHDAQSCTVGETCRQVPEPSTLLLLGSGLLGAMALRRRKK